MFYRLKRYLATSWFNLGIRRITDTPPVTGDPESRLVLVSQLCHRDVPMYLLAVKSLARFVQPKRVVVLDDTTLTESDKSQLRQHIGPLDILPFTAVENRACPRGKTWERLLLIADLVESDYVVQLDSDTLTLQLPEAVLQHLEKNTSFTLAGDDGEDIVPASETVARMRPRLRDRNEHVQLVSEANLDQVMSVKPLRYVRGSSAFAGFGRNSFSRKSVEDFSMSMAQAIGRPKWDEWGSEQVTSNLVVANTPDAAVLPFSEYCYHRPELALDRRRFIHFMGTYRFRNGRYRRLGRQVIREISQSGWRSGPGPTHSGL